MGKANHPDSRSDAHARAVPHHSLCSLPSSIRLAPAIAVEAAGFGLWVRVRACALNLSLPFWST